MHEREKTERWARDPIRAKYAPLLLSLVREVRTASATRRSNDRDQVLLDAEVEGVRCVLIARGPAPFVPLSPRESEIACMVAKGYGTKQIAAVLEISSWTVATHLRRTFAKLGVRSRAAMVAQLADAGYLRPRDDPGPRFE
jgi:DNA-binding CsgD family transcriptional regulator